VFTVNGNPIIEDEQTVLYELKRQSDLAGLNIMRVFRPTGHNIMTTCPFHHEGLERKPSFGISKTDMKCHCFSCGWAGTLDQMISNIFGYDDEGAYGRQWLAKTFLTVSIETRKALQLNLVRGAKRVAKPVAGFTEVELASYRYYHPYMYKRGLTNEIIEMFDVGYDSGSECITFPVYDVNKAPVFIARRSVKSKFFHYPEGAHKPVYGGERFTSGEFSEAVISESILNCLTGWKFNKPGIALIGTGTEEQYRILRSLPIRKYIIATDPDPAGQRAAEKLRKELCSCKIVTQYLIPEGQDLNSLDSRILELPQYF